MNLSISIISSIPDFLLFLLFCSCDLEVVLILHCASDLQPPFVAYSATLDENIDAGVCADPCNTVPTKAAKDHKALHMIESQEYIKTLKGKEKRSWQPKVKHAQESLFIS